MDIGADGRAALDLRCPADARDGCSGTARLELEGRTLASAAYMLAPSQYDIAIFTLSAEDVRVLRRRCRTPATVVLDRREAPPLRAVTLLQACFPVPP